MIEPSNMNHVIAESLGLLRHHNIYYSDLNTVVDVCEEFNGNCTQICIHESHRRFYCSCESGYVLDTDMADCVSECDIENGGCSDYCTLSDGEVACSCEDGYVLDDDQKTCIGQSVC